jgi:hypothetical protein
VIRWRKVEINVELLVAFFLKSERILRKLNLFQMIQKSNQIEQNQILNYFITENVEKQNKYIILRLPGDRNMQT